MTGYLHWAVVALLIAACWLAVAVVIAFALHAHQRLRIMADTKWSWKDAGRALRDRQVERDRGAA
jgi:hypothetical protein